MKDAFGDRMKLYEAASNTVLPPRLPVILRLDGHGFSKLTERYFDKPFDPVFEQAMNEAALNVLEFTQALFAYVQSDEITLLLRNDRSRGDAPFLANRIQKLCSLAAAEASVSFVRSSDTRGTFDCRAFVVPAYEVNNVFLWRQRDAFKNCIGAVAHYKLVERDGLRVAVRRLAGMSTRERLDLLVAEFGISLADLPLHRQRGRCVERYVEEVAIEQVVPPDKLAQLITEGRIVAGTQVERHGIRLNDEIPDFHEDENYIGLLAFPDDILEATSA